MSLKAKIIMFWYATICCLSVLGT